MPVRRSTRVPITRRSIYLRACKVCRPAGVCSLVAALEGLERFAGDSSLSTWLFGILKHKIVDIYRRVPAEESLDTCEEELLHDGPGPERACASRSALAVLDRSLGFLPTKAAHAFVLREVEIGRAHV